jgi:hypothetical protein
MIGSGGLLLVVSHLFAVSILVLWVGLEKIIIIIITIIECGNIFARLHTDHCWRCSYIYIFLIRNIH